MLPKLIPSVALADGSQPGGVLKAAAALASRGIQLAERISINS